MSTGQQIEAYQTKLQQYLQTQKDSLTQPQNKLELVNPLSPKQTNPTKFI